MGKHKQDPCCSLISLSIFLPLILEELLLIRQLGRARGGGARQPQGAMLHLLLLLLLLLTTIPHGNLKFDSMAAAKAACDGLKEQCGAVNDFNCDGKPPFWLADAGWPVVYSRTSCVASNRPAVDGVGEEPLGVYDIREQTDEIPFRYIYMTIPPEDREL